MITTREIVGCDYGVSAGGRGSRAHVEWCHYVSQKAMNLDLRGGYSAGCVAKLRAVANYEHHDSLSLLRGVGFR